MEVSGKLHALVSMEKVPGTHQIEPQNLSEQVGNENNPTISTGNQTPAIQSAACYFTE
jgi:hypothetical protein